MKRTHICRADIERYCFSFVQSFYDAFNVFNDLLSDKSFLKTYAQKLSCRRLLKLQEIDEKGLNQEEIQIAREAITLLMSEQGEPTQWRTLLVRIGKRIEQRQIIQWATQFYHEYEKLVAASNIENLSATLDQLQKLAFSQIIGENPTIETDLFLFLELEIEQQYVEEVARLKDEIKRLYDAQVKDIQKYLAPSGNGIIEYLREITQISLIGI